MTQKQGRSPASKVRKGKQARSTQVHEPKKRSPRRDRFHGQILDDWFEQQIEELKDDTTE